MAAAKAGARRLSGRHRPEVRQAAGGAQRRARGAQQDRLGRAAGPGDGRRGQAAPGLPARTRASTRTAANRCSRAASTRIFPWDSAAAAKPAGPRRVAVRSQAPADRARVRQSHVADAFRAGAGGDGGELRRRRARFRRIPTCSTGSPVGFMRVGLGRQAPAPDDRRCRRPIASGRNASDLLQEQRPAQRPAGARASLPHAGRDWCATTRWPPAACSSRGSAGRACIRTSRTTMWNPGITVHRYPTPKRSRRRSPPAQSVHVHQAERAASAAASCSICRIANLARCAGRRRTRRCRRSCCSTTRSSSRPIVRWRPMR